jgi:hypothetical protein
LHLLCVSEADVLLTVRHRCLLVMAPEQQDPDDESRDHEGDQRPPEKEREHSFSETAHAVTASFVDSITSSRPMLRTWIGEATEPMRSYRTPAGEAVRRVISRRRFGAPPMCVSVSKPIMGAT